MRINDIYEKLKENNLCRSGHDFSRDYLGKHHSYLSMLKARDQRASIEAWLMLSYSLQSRAQVLAASENPFILEAATHLTKLQKVVATTIIDYCVAKNR